MIRLEKSEAVQRKVRQDDVTELAIPTWTLVREAIQSGRTDEALDFMEYECTRNKEVHDILVQFMERFITHIASFGEEEVEKIWRQIFDSLAGSLGSRALSVEETLQLDAEFQRCHYGDFTVVEEPDRYVMTCDPCGSLGRLRRTRSVGVTKKAYPWSRGKSGVPYYCTHCAIFWEIIPIEQQEYPKRIHLLGDRPEDPCVHLFYKKPELIPEEYFTRIGKTKTIK